MLPIVNSPLKKLGSNTPGSAFYAERYGSKQVKPYNLELPFAYRAGFNISGNVMTRPPGTVGDFPYSIGMNLDSLLGTQSYAVDARNKARERFISQCKTTTSFGESIAQWKSTRDLLAKHLLEVGEFAAALLGGKKKLVKKLLLKRANRASNSLRNFPNSGRELGRLRRNADAKVRSWIKKPASAFIEGHFVWSPLFQDIHTLSNAMLTSVPLNRVKSSATYRSGPLYQRQDISAIEGKDASFFVEVKCKISGYPVITNPELLYLDNLGMLNAPLLAWNLLPFSWLVDWFTNVSDMLSQMSDTRGYRIDNPATTMIYKGTSYNQAWYKPVNPSLRWSFFRCTGGLCIIRNRSLPPVTFTVSIPPSLSWQRGLTVASLIALIGLRN